MNKFLSTYKFNIIWAIVILAIIYIAVQSYNRNHPPVTVVLSPLMVTVISVDDNILDGKWIGGLLSSSSGNIRSDTIVVGVSYTINGEIYLDDFELYHSEAASISKENEIAMELATFSNKKQGSCAQIQYNHHVVTSKHYLVTAYDLKHKRRWCIKIK